MCSSSLAFLVSCIAVGVNGMAIQEIFSSLPNLTSEITPLLRCFVGRETEKGLQCLADALGRTIPPGETGLTDQDLSLDDFRIRRHLNDTEPDYDEANTDNHVEKKQIASFKEGRKKRRKGNMMIPAAIGLAAIIMTVIVGVIGVVAGKALALSFLALVLAVALSTRAVASHQRSTVVKDDIPEALTEIGHQLLVEDKLPKDAIVYSSYRKRND